MNRRLRRKVRVGVHSTAEERTRFGKITIVVLVVLTAVVILTVIWGNYLKRKAAEAGQDPAGSRNTMSGNISNPLNNGAATLPPSEYNAKSVPITQARYVILSSSAHIDWAARATEYKKNGTTAVSLVLYYGGGKLNFSSKTAQAMSYQTAGDGKTNLVEATVVLDAAGIYTSGCFYINYTTKSTPGLIGVYRAYEAALVAEAIDSGFSDVLLLGCGTDESAALEVSRFIGEVRGLEKDAVLGVAVPCGSLSGAAADKILGDLAASAKFLALDLTEIKDASVLMAELERTRAYIEKYNLRLVLSMALENMTGELSEAGYDNWQIVP